MSLNELLTKPRVANRVVDCSTINNDEWLEYRKGGIGGSDSASILGISKWRTQLELYYDKIGESSTEEIDEQREYIFDFGHAMEEFVAVYYQKVFERKFKDSLELKFSLHYGEDIRIEKCRVYRDTWMYESPEYPFMRADLDFKVDLTLSSGQVVTGIFECKTTSPFSIKDSWESGPPKYYECQTRHYMAVMDVPFAIIACAADNNANNYYSHVIFRDNDKEKVLIEAEKEFWWSVKNRIPPYEMGVDNTKTILGHCNIDPNSKAKSVPEDNGAFVKNKIAEIQAYQENIAALKSSIKSLEEKENILKSDLLTYMMSNDKITFETSIGDNVFLTSISESTRKAVDYNKVFKAIEQEFPDISNEIEKIKETHTTRKITKKVAIKKADNFKKKSA